MASTLGATLCEFHTPPIRGGSLHPFPCLWAPPFVHLPLAKAYFEIRAYEVQKSAKGHSIHTHPFTGSPDPPSSVSKKNGPVAAGETHTQSSPKKQSAFPGCSDCQKVLPLDHRAPFSISGHRS